VGRKHARSSSERFEFLINTAWRSCGGKISGELKWKVELLHFNFRSGDFPLYNCNSKWERRFCGFRGFETPIELELGKFEENKKFGESLTT
jgi:hypothetical protein